MEYWKESYDELNYEISDLENKIGGLSCRIYRAEANIFSLKTQERLDYDDEFEYEGKTVEEKIEIAKEIIEESKEEKEKLENDLYYQKEKLIAVSKSIIDSTYWFMNCCWNNSQLLTPKQKQIFKEETDRKVGNILGRRLLNL